MNSNKIHSCHLGPEISPEQFITEHFFLYLLEGSMIAYDGQNTYTIQPGDPLLARKNHLIRYTKHKNNSVFRKVVITLEKPFLVNFLERHDIDVYSTQNTNSLLFLPDSTLLQSYIKSLEPYYTQQEEIEKGFEDVKREELLLILLKTIPELKDILFNFAIPDKIDLEEFMNRNFRFNVSLDRFAYMTGRSLSTFKRDFQKIFGSTPGTWLTRKRLEEAYFRIKSEGAKPGDIYYELGFEDFSHFSFAFRKQFGIRPTALLHYSDSTQ
ncbi:AraC family transcriptional regulator [Xanthocytophaga agilis]|uniref:AraC family transcriptional regulator n=1 Tax=Xanthocytophaga agilis TaxID=3048010 RepID=A0AAE3QWQ8_9BACT|nr:AraC family transcriptional regulator [Xanthocytophaga agilis]MDJ1499484.1 AraC family transcriptional regulator [Xanthocytophaga agilis]